MSGRPTSNEIETANVRWRRLITVDDREERSHLLSEGFVDDVLLDPARPGFSIATVWATDATPAIARRPERFAQISRTIEPPPGGSVFRIVTIPPDAGWISRCSEQTVRAYFAAAGSPQASCYGSEARHPYMQQTRSLDLCVVLEGEITLVLDTEEVVLGTGDTVVQRGTRHAWANRSDSPCVIAISSHDAEAAQT